MFSMLAITALMMAIALSQAQAQKQIKEAPNQVLIKNVNVFDGKSEKLTMAQDVLVEGNPIEDLMLLMDKDKIPVIMKDGKIYKNAQ